MVQGKCNARVGICWAKPNPSQLKGPEDISITSALRFKMMSTFVVTLLLVLELRDAKADAQLENINTMGLIEPLGSNG